MPHLARKKLRRGADDSGMQPRRGFGVCDPVIGQYPQNIFRLGIAPRKTQAQSWYSRRRRSCLYFVDHSLSPFPMSLRYAGEVQGLLFFEKITS